LKKKNIYVSVILILLMVGFGLKKANDIFSIFSSNSINVTAENPVKKEKVKIEFGISVNTINRVNDSDLFRNRSKYIVLFDGEEKDEMVNEYGENDFLVTYDNKYYISFRQFKFNQNNKHDYSFHLFQKDNRLYISVKISGKDNMEFTRPMNEIRSAVLLKCNVPIDSAGYIYNMIELVNPNK
jgi:hypothetical protein